MLEQKRQIYGFDDFRLDVPNRQLLRNGESVALPAKAFDMLVVLIENSGRLLGKDELFSSVWPDQIVEESNLTVQVSAIRKALGERKENPRYIVTVPGHGYRFIGELISVDEEEEEVVIEHHSLSRLTVESEITAGENEGAVIKGSAPQEISQLTAGAEVETSKRPLTVGWRTLVPAVMFVIALSIGAYVWQRENRTKTVSHHAASQMKISQLTTNGRVTVATASTEGRFVVFAQKEVGGESLWLRQTKTGSQTQILPPQELEFVGLSISPDSNFVYYSIFIGDKSDTQLWRIPIIGGAQQEIPRVVTANAISFSPDGKQFAYTVSAGPETSLRIADADGSNERVLLDTEGGRHSFPFWKASPVAWSPHDSAVACAVYESSDDRVRAGILLINLADGSSRYLIEPWWTDIQHLAWLDDESLAFAGYDGDHKSYQIWTVSRNTGEVQRLTNGTASYAWLATANGQIFTVQQNITSSLQVAPFNEKTETFEPREILSETGNISNVAWDHDGAIVYDSQTTGKGEIWRVNADGSGPTQLTTDANVWYGLAVSPANGELVFGSTRNGKHSLWLANSDGKNQRPFTYGDEDKLASFSPDGQSVFFQRRVKIDTIWRVTSRGDKPSQLTREISLYPTASPAGDVVACFFMDTQTDGAWKVALISSATGDLLSKLSFPTFVTERLMTWHPSGRFLTLGYETGGNAGVLLLPTNGGETKSISNLFKGEISALAWSPDGRRVAFSRNVKTRDMVGLSDFR